MIWAIVLAAGQGARFGGSGKQFERLGDRPLVDWAVAAAATACDGVVLVLPASGERSHPTSEAAAVVAGGATRADSVRCGLAAVPADADVVVVHDAARPLAPPALFDAVVEAVRAGADGAVPGLPVVDTIKRVHDGQVAETLDRGSLVAVQTPQAFRADVLRLAHAEDADATDDAALVEQRGGRVVVVPGDPRALKITVPDDLERAERLVGRADPVARP